MKYRIAIAASVVISVSAENDEDALQKAREWAKEAEDGIVTELPVICEENDGRVYLLPQGDRNEDFSIEDRSD